MENKSKLIYKIITIITLGLPLPLYLFLSATLFNIIRDYTIENIDISEVVVVEGEQLFMYSNNAEAIYNGTVVNNNGTYGFYIDEDTIIKIENDFYSYTEEGLTDISKFEIQQQTSYKLPVSFIVSIVGIGIVFLVIKGKMEWAKDHPRIAVLLSLVVGTVILYVLDTLIGGILNVFLIASASWAMYCLEYLVQQNKIDKATADKEESELINTLKQALK